MRRKRVVKSIIIYRKSRTYTAFDLCGRSEGQQQLKNKWFLKQEGVSNIQGKDIIADKDGRKG